MAERRMFTKKITDDDHFMSLSSSAQALYLHLSMAADDDGFCNQVSMAMFRSHASTEDLKSLLEKRYIYQFENGVIVIKHWRMANALRKDRYTPTTFKNELAMLKLDENGAYTMGNGKPVADWLPDGCQVVADWLPQDRLGKDREDKERIGEDSEGKTKERKAHPMYFPNDEVLNSAFADYVNMRKKIKAPMTDRAIDLAMKKLTEMGDADEQVKILNQSIMNSWKGLFPLKEKESKSKGTDWDNLL